MARPTQHFALFRAGQRLATSIVTLAYWRWRQQWLLLAVTGIGMIAAVMVVCIVPLLSEVTLTAGVRDILTASPGNAEMMLRATTFGLSTAGVHGVFQAVNAPFRQNLHPYLQGLPRFELQTLNFPSRLIIACAIPLLSEVTTTAGLHTLMEASPGNSQVLLDTSTLGLSSRIAQDVHKRFDASIQRHIGSNLESTVPFFLQTSGFSVAPSSPAAHLYPSVLPQGNYDVRLVGTALDQAQSASSHLTLLQGRLPQATNSTLETLLTPATAQSLHVTVGSTLTLRFDYATQLQGLYGQNILQGFLQLHIVGLFNVSPTNVPYWNGNDFQPNKTAQMSIYTLLIPQNAFIATIDRFAIAAHTNAIFLPHGYELLWYYSLNIGSITYPQLDTLAYQLTQLENDITNTLSSTQNTAQQNSLPSYPYLTQVNLLNPGTASYTLPNTLAQYQSRVIIFSIPNALLTLLIIGIILFFVGLMVDILIDRQAPTIALLRSRGASDAQIFNAFTVQSVVVGVLALLIGLPLAYFTASLIARQVIAPTDPL